MLEGSVVIAEYTYNANELRTRKILANGETTVYHYDQQGLLMAETTDTGALIREYIWLDGQPLAQIDAAGSVETLTYLHTDHLMTPRLATDTFGTVIWRWDSTAFGDTLPDENVDGDGFATTINLRFPGQYWDTETGLHYNWHRYYEPSTGRYLENDSIGLEEGLNTYGYAFQNPIRNYDPDGQFVIALAHPRTWVALGKAVAFLGSATMAAWVGNEIINQYREKIEDIVDSINETEQDSTTIPWPPKKSGKWTCICRADANLRSPDLTCEFHKMFAFGWGIGATMQDAYKIAERNAKDLLMASSVHHVQCKCTGPKGEKRNRGS